MDKEDINWAMELDKHDELAKIELLVFDGNVKGVLETCEKYLDFILDSVLNRA